MKIRDKYIEPCIYTADDVSSFIKLSGDTNPIHYDKQYASTTVFQRPIVHGLLAVTVFSKIFGTTFPQPGCIYMEQNFKFIHPMYIDVEYIAEVEIVNISRDIIYVQTNLKDRQDNYTVIGTAVLKLNKK